MSIDRRHWLPRLLGGSIRAAISITEPDVPGSDPKELKFEARREGDEYVLKTVATIVENDQDKHVDKCPMK